MDFSDTLTRIENEPMFMIRSEWDQRVIDHDDVKQFINSIEFGNTNQLWVVFETSTAIKIMNVGQKELLKSSGQGIYEWTYSQDTKLLLDPSGTGKALRRGKAKKDGALIGGVNSKNYNGRNKYVFEPQA